MLCTIGCRRGQILLYGSQGFAAMGSWCGRLSRTMQLLRRLYWRDEMQFSAPPGEKTAVSPDLAAKK